MKKGAAVLAVRLWHGIPILSRDGHDWNRIPRPRRAFTVTESLVALAVLVVIMAVLTDLTVGSLMERRRNTTRQQVIETAMNILESAQACDWDALTPDWGKARRLPEALADLLNEGKLQVTVEPEASRPQTRRVTVEISWQQDGKETRPVKLVGWRSARTAVQPGGKP